MAPFAGFAVRLDKTARSGPAYDIDAHTPGNSAIGAGFVDHAGDLFAISVPIPSSRFAERKSAVELALSQTIARINADFRKGSGRGARG